MIEGSYFLLIIYVKTLLILLIIYVNPFIKVMITKLTCYILNFKKSVCIINQKEN